MDIGWDLIALLLIAAAAAGWVDAVVGGGGLLMLPALLVAFPNAPVAPLLGTNKLAAVFGTASAAITYSGILDRRRRSGPTQADTGPNADTGPVDSASADTGPAEPASADSDATGPTDATGGPPAPERPDRVRLEPRVVWPTAGLALLGSGAGAALAGAISSATLRPVIMVVLATVALLVVLRPALGSRRRTELFTPNRIVAAVLLAGGGVAFYDGLIGPGTGTFLIIALTTVVGLDFVAASATAKIVNTATNLGALAVFAYHGDIIWLLGLALAACNIAGAQIGAHMALRRGSGFVRVVLLVVVAALLVKLGWEQFAA